MKTTPLQEWIFKRTGIITSKELETYQLMKLKETICYAKKNSPFYKKKYREMPKINTIDDFKRLPFTTTEDISQAPFDFIALSQKKIDRVVTLNTSGTMDEKKRIFFTDADLQKTVVFFDYGMRSLVDSTDRVMVLLPGPAYGTIGDLLKKALARTGTFCHVFGLANDLDAVEKEIIEHRINCLVGIPIQILYLSRIKSDCFKRIKNVLLSTDYIPQFMVDELKRKFNCRLFKHYGMTEMGYGGGQECAARCGYHLREMDLYFEVIDQDSGLPVEDGQPGEVVFTSFDREAMPLIRYRTGDIGIFSTEPCPCGTFLRRLETVEGRIKNRIELGNGHAFDLKELEEILLGFEFLIDYQVTIKDYQILLIDVAFYDMMQMKTKEKLIKEKLEAYFREKEGQSICVEIRNGWIKRPNQMINSMIKRKIYDQRKA